MSEIKGLTKSEVLNLFSNIRTHFSDCKIVYGEMKYGEYYEAGCRDDFEEKHNLDYLEQTFDQHLRFILNIRCKEGVIALSFFNSREGFVVSGSWFPKKRKDAPYGEHPQVFPLKNIVLEASLPNYILEFFVKNMQYLKML
jgi:hypothetical protein